MMIDQPGHKATLLPDGKVLITGGFGGENGHYLTLAEVYDPATGTFNYTGSMLGAREWHTATLLANGKVLVAGGRNGLSLGDPHWHSIASAELYCPTGKGGVFSLIGSLGISRERHSATLLSDGKVLIAGGFNQSNPYIFSAELYDPNTGTFGPTGSMLTRRAGHSATLLLNGKVLIAGGFTYYNDTFSSAELYDPSTGAFSATGSMGTGHINHTATLLPNGKVLIAGGGGYYLGHHNFSGTLYDPDTGIFSTAGSLAMGRNGHTATLLSNGGVLIAGVIFNYYGIFTDDHHFYIPSGEIFQATSPVAVEIGSDLVISTLKGPGTVRPGQTVTFSEATKNQGKRMAGASVTKYYLSRNSIYDSRARDLGERSVPSLAPGAESGFSLRVTFPLGTSPGTYYVIAIADANRQVQEISETNNIKVLQLTITP